MHGVFYFINAIKMFYGELNLRQCGLKNEPFKTFFGAIA